MAWVAAGAGAVAVACLVPPPAPALRRLATSRRSLRGRRRGLVVSGAVLGLLLVLGLADNVASPFLLLGVVASSTLGLLGWHSRRTRAARQEAERVARSCQVLAGQLRVGRIPVEALATAAEDCPSLAEVVSAQRIGADVSAVLRSASRKPGAAGLASLASAWYLAERSGAPMAAAAEHVSTQLADAARLRRAVSAELAPARATGKLLAALPLVGIAMGFLMGGHPDEFLLVHPLGRWCLAMGISLACLGVLWTEVLAERVERRTR